MPLWSLHLTSGLEWQWSCSQVKCLWENSGTSWHGECWLTLHVPHKIHLLQLWPWMWWYQKMSVWEMIDVFLSIQFSLSVMSDSLWPCGLQHARLPFPSPNPGALSNSCPLSWWCFLTISSSVVPFSSCLQSFPASESFPMSSSHQVAKGLKLLLQHHSFQWIIRNDFF